MHLNSNKPSLHVVQLDRMPIFQQLQFEEGLLRTNTKNWCLLNKGSDPAIVMGISGNPDKLINSFYMAHSPIPIIRRFSGGGTVVTDHNTLFVTLICQSDALNIPPFPRSIMDWSATLYRPLLPDQFALRENDYVLGEKKWGGNAQSITKNRWLHHSSLLWNYDTQLMNYLLIPSKMPEYRNQREHTDFLCCLEDYWENEKSVEESLIDQLNLSFEICSVSQEEMEKDIYYPHRQTTRFISLTL